MHGDLFPHWYYCQEQYKEYLQGLLDIRKKFEVTFPRYTYVDYVVNRTRIEDQSVCNGKIWFITVSPHTTTTLSILMDRMKRLSERVFMKDSCYVYEQTGKDDKTIGNHPHVHILLHKVKGMSPAQIRDRIYSTFKGLGQKNVMIDVKEYPSRLFEEKKLYMAGKKWDEAKEEACVLNEKWRVQNNLKNIYYI